MWDFNLYGRGTISSVGGSGFGVRGSQSANRRAEYQGKETPHYAGAKANRYPVSKHTPHKRIAIYSKISLKVINNKIINTNNIKNTFNELL
jgi:hypothetical protein